MVKKKKKLRKFLVEWRGGYGEKGHSIITGKDIRNALRRNGTIDVEHCLRYGMNWYEEKK